MWPRCRGRETGPDSRPSSHVSAGDHSSLASTQQPSLLAGCAAAREEGQEQTSQPLGLGAWEIGPSAASVPLLPVSSAESR